MAVAALLAGGAVALNSGIASATTATITGVALTTSNNAASGGGVTNTGVYTVNFSTATAAIVPTVVKFTVPAGTTFTNTPTATVYGITGCTTTTPTLATTTVTETFSGTCGSVAIGTAVQIQVSKFKNGTTTATFKTKATVNTVSGTAATGIPFANNTTAVTISVPDSLTFSNSNTSILMLPIPGGATVVAPNVTLTVGTNAKGGYTLAGCVLSTIKGTTNATQTIGQLSAKAATLPATATNFGANPTVTGTGAVVGATWAHGTYLGYNSTCGSTGHSVIMKSTVPVSNNTLTLSNAVRVKTLQAADKYTGTITYQVTPSY
jgi:hypothetical protein